jgi:uncharacterized membrane protein
MNICTCFAVTNLLIFALCIDFMHFVLFLDSKNVGSIVSDLEIEALSTAMANQLKFEVCFHLVIFGHAYLY